MTLKSHAPFFYGVRSSTTEYCWYGSWFSCSPHWILRVHGRWFRLSRDQFDALHYGGMSIFKIGIILFNLVPFVVLSMLGKSR